MAEQIIQNAAALRLFFTEEVYVVAENNSGNPGRDLHLTIDAGSTIAASLVQDPASFKYLGKNQKNVLILVNDEGNEVSTGRGKELLRNLLKAIQLTANDFALLNYASCKGVDFARMHNFFSCKAVLVFGVRSSVLGLAEFQENAIHLQDKAQLIFAGNLHDLAIDQEGKKALWGSLKKLSI